MTKVFILQGFKDYEIIDKVLYRKAYVAKSKNCKFQYRQKREIKISIKDGAKGYYLNGKFHTLKSLRHRLKKVN